MAGLSKTRGMVGCQPLVRGTYVKGSYIEEPDEAKVSRPVLEARQGGDSLSLASVSRGNTGIDPNC